MPSSRGAVAQLGERRVRNAKVVGSIPIRSTTRINKKAESSRFGFFVALPPETTKAGSAGLRLQMVPSRRFERPTCPLGGGRSIQLSYEGKARILAWIDALRDPANLTRLLESAF